MRRVGLSLLASLVLAAPALAEEAAPSIRPLRYDEDWRAFCASDASRRGREALKCIALSETTTLSVGGEARWRYEWVDNPGFGLDGAGEDEVLLQRLMVHGDLRLADRVRVFVQVGDWRATDRNFGAPPTDRSRLDLAQGFVDLSAPVGARRLTLRAGRQEIAFGSNRLVSVRESPNIRRSFDGVLFELAPTSGSWQIEAFATRPVAPERGSFDDSADGAGALYGIYARALPLPRGAMDLYWLAYERDGARFAQGQADERRHSLGTRLFGVEGAFDWDVEGVWQFGAFGGSDISAWTVASDFGWTWARAPWSPRLGLKADIASGDGDLGDGALGTFNALFPRFPYFSEANLVAPSNVADVQPSLSLAPTPDVTLSLTYNALWKHQAEDAFYLPPLDPAASTTGRSRWIGWQAGLGTEWRVNDNLTLSGTFIRFEAGGALRAAGGDDGSFGFAQAALKF